jgi:hypothetical protein
METLNSPEMNLPVNTSSPIQEQLGQLFAYKAEWLRERLFELYTEPSYLPELTTSRQCALIGGRGTGKTTVLRGLSYTGQHALNKRAGVRANDFPYYGFYYRIDTNRVTAFQGPELDEGRWAKVFGHYMNLVLCDLVLKFLDWFQIHGTPDTELPERDCEKIAASLHLAEVHTFRELANELDRAKTKFEAYINNVADHEPISLSMQGAPIDAILEGFTRIPAFVGKQFFFLLDEYENLTDYQQQVVNTLIKHAGELYTFKIGVRELGWRCRTTLNENEQLISPADYDRIDISKKLKGQVFRDFAHTVCSDRLSRIKTPDISPILDVERALPGISADEEAAELGVREAVESLEGEVTLHATPEELDVLRRVPPLQAFLVRFWADGHNRLAHDVLAEFCRDQRRWEERYGNFKHVMLFSLRRRKRGIQKYYAGWGTFTKLAGDNIRYLLELVDQSLQLHLNEGFDLSRPVSPKSQTIAAQGVGKKNLSELEGLSRHGADLTKLLLGLGRVFGVMARTPAGHAPEINQFHLSEKTLTTDVNNLLKAAVMHLALVRTPGNKLADEGDTKDYDYMIHPVFSAFFIFSHRRKRKMILDPSELLGLVRKTKSTIREILSRNNRAEDDEPLPQQLLLFESFYHGNP